MNLLNVSPSISFNSEEWDDVAWLYEELEPTSFIPVDEDLWWVGNLVYSIVLCADQRLDPWSVKWSSIQ